MTPLYLSSTFAFEGVDKPGPFDYTRTGNPTRKALEDSLAELEGGIGGFAFNSGMAAEAAVLDIFNCGDHLIVHDDLYGGTYRLLTGTKVRQGLEVDFLNLRDTDALENAIKENTRAIWVESPTNPLMNLVDLKTIGEIGKKHNIITICDNTFLSPYFQRPLEMDFDIVVHSTTKYINGHSDVVGGAVVTGSPDLAERIGYQQNSSGSGQSPFDCYMVLRGLKTLAVRMEVHNKNALEIASWLEKHEKIEKVIHPGLKSHPQFDLAQKQMTGFGGTFSFCVKGGKEEAFRLLENMNIFTLAESLGGVESLIEHPCTMTHLSMPEDVRRRIGITDNLIRISIGIEHVSDLIDDLDNALKSV